MSMSEESMLLLEFEIPHMCGAHEIVAPLDSSVVSVSFCVYY